VSLPTGHARAGRRPGDRWPVRRPVPVTAGRSVTRATWVCTTWIGAVFRGGAAIHPGL